MTRRAARTSPFTVLLLELDDHTAVARYIPRASTPQAAIEAAVEWADKAPFNGYEVIAVYPGVAPLIPEHEGGVFFEWGGGMPTRSPATPAGGGGHTVLLFDLGERITISHYVKRTTTPRGAIAAVERSLGGRDSRIENYDIVGVLHGENDPIDEAHGGLHFAYSGARGR